MILSLAIPDGSSWTAVDHEVRREREKVETNTIMHRIEPPHLIAALVTSSESVVGEEGEDGDGDDEVEEEEERRE